MDQETYRLLRAGAHNGQVEAHLMKDLNWSWPDATIRAQECDHLLFSYRNQRMAAPSPAQQNTYLDAYMTAYGAERAAIIEGSA